MPQLTDNTIAETLAGVTESEIDTFAAHVAAMTDDEMRVRFHLGNDSESDALIADLRKLQSMCGR